MRKKYTAIVKTTYNEGLKYHNITNLANFQRWVMNTHELNAIFFYDKKTREYLGHWRSSYPLGIIK